MARRGAVILEAIVALTLLAVILSVVAQASARQGWMEVDARRELAAREALCAEMERLRAVPFEEVSTSRPRPLADADLPGATIASDVAPEADDLRRVTVTVAWTGSQDRPRTRSLSTLRARAGGPR